MQSWPCNMSKFDIKKIVQRVYHSSKGVQMVSDDTVSTSKMSPALVKQLQEPLAHLAELVDALVLGTSDFGRGSSSLPVGIFYLSSTGLT